jgi:hypothetical protein
MPNGVALVENHWKQVTDRSMVSSPENKVDSSWLTKIVTRRLVSDVVRLTIMISVLVVIEASMKSVPGVVQIHKGE